MLELDWLSMLCLRSSRPVGRGGARARTAGLGIRGAALGKRAQLGKRVINWRGTLRLVAPGIIKKGGGRGEEKEELRQSPRPVKEN